MDRFDSDLHLTTGQVAGLLHVHPSTVKRWCDDDEIAYGTTGGGHRRIHLSAVLAVSREREIETFLDPFSPYEAHVWSAVRAARDGADFRRARTLAFGWLIRGHAERLRLFAHTLGRLCETSLTAFFDAFIHGFMVDVGRAWEQGRLGVGGEHMASQAIMEALLQLRSDSLAKPGGVPEGNGDGKVAVVGSLQGEDHQIGALCIRLLLEREGWEVVYLGASVPVEEFDAVQRSVGARLVGVSLAPPRGSGDVLRALRILQHLGHGPREGYDLVFGGGACAAVELTGSGPHPIEEVRCFTASEPFLLWLRERHTPAAPEEDAR